MLPDATVDGSCDLHVRVPGVEREASTVIE